MNAKTKKRVLGIAYMMAVASFFGFFGCLSDINHEALWILVDGGIFLSSIYTINKLEDTIEEA